MTARPDLPAHVAAAAEEGQRAWIEAYDEAVQHHGDDARARAAADEALGRVLAAKAPPGGDET